MAVVKETCHGGGAMTRNGDRNNMVKRQWRILQFLAANRFATFQSIAAQAGGYCLKTVRRDIAALQEVGFPIVFIPNADSNGVFVRLDRNWLDLHAAPAQPRHLSTHHTIGDVR